MATPHRPGYSPDAWEPSDPGKAVGDRSVLLPTTDERADQGVPYTPAPASSHLHGWKALTSSFTANFYAESQGFARGTFLLQVGFRAKSGVAGLKNEYLYGFRSAAEVDRWVGQLDGHPEPGKLIPSIRAACVGERKLR